MKVGRMNKLNNQNNYIKNTGVEGNKRLVTISVSRNNIIIKNGIGRFKRGPYKGASLSLSPEEITTLYQVGTVVGGYVIGTITTNYFTKKGAQASRGTSKICNFKKPLYKKICGKPLYFRNEALDINGRTIEISRCDDGHEYIQPVISAVKLPHKKTRT